jgi:hypothetical protein
MTRGQAEAGPSAEHAARSGAAHATNYAVRSVQPLARSRALTRCPRRCVPDAQERDGGEKRWVEERMRRGTEITAHPKHPQVMSIVDALP